MQYLPIPGASEHVPLYKCRPEHCPVQYFLITGPKLEIYVKSCLGFLRAPELWWLQFYWLGEA